MDRNSFKKMYDDFNASSETGYFKIEDWRSALTSWQPFYDEITSADGLSLDRWLKNSTGYLPDYLDTKEQKFGHARIGNYDQVMIYQFTGWNDPSERQIHKYLYKE